jgi:hypothetical protein
MLYRKLLPYYQTEGRVSALAERCLRSVRLFQAYVREPVEGARFGQACQANFWANLRLSLTQLQSALVIGAIAASGAAAVAYVGAPHVLAGQLSVGELLVFLAYIAMFYSPLVQLVMIEYPILCGHSRDFGHDLRHGFRGPVEGMRVLIPFTNELCNLGLEVLFRFKISDAQAFALEDAEPLLHLIHP